MTVDEIEREYYLQGNPLPEYLVEMAEIGEKHMEITSVGDITAGFPDEDFLDEVILDIDCIIEEMHGNNKTLPALKELSEKLRDVANTTRLNAAYGNEEVNKLKKALGI